MPKGVGQVTSVVFRQIKKNGHTGCSGVCVLDPSKVRLFSAPRLATYTKNSINSINNIISINSINNIISINSINNIISINSINNIISIKSINNIISINSINNIISIKSINSIISINIINSMSSIRFSDIRRVVQYFY